MSLFPIRTRAEGRRLWLVLGLLALALLRAPASAAYLRDYPVTLTQPDGFRFSCFVTGDEFSHRLHDAAGYTIVKDPGSGFFVYAALVSGRVRPSAFRPGVSNPGLLGLPKNLVPGPAVPRADPSTPAPRLKGSPRRPDEIRRAPHQGGFDNLVIFIRFSDEKDYEDSIAYYLSLFDLEGEGLNTLANYYREVSYGQLAIRTFFCPIPARLRVLSYRDAHPRAYYQPYDDRTNTDGYPDDRESAQREQDLLARAVEAVADQVPAGLTLDGDGDGFVDNVCFIVKGDPDGWGDLLWPHMWSLYYANASIRNLRVYTFNFQLENALKRNGVGVLCHEMFHSLGAPDLYHYDDDGLQPVGPWDIMENDLDPPQHMGAYMKAEYGQWIASIPEITREGTYTLHPLTSSTNNAFKIRTSVSSNEFFVLEYRRRTGTFESSLPGEGLLIYRIDSRENGNAEGPPDEVYVYRPGGTLVQDGRVREAAFSREAGRTTFNDSTDPFDFLSDGRKGRLSISEVGSAGETISFRVSFPAVVKVTSPRLVTWRRGETRVITWERSGRQAGAVRIRLLKDGGWVEDIAFRAPNTGRFVWRIPSTLAPGRGYRIRVETVDDRCSDVGSSFTLR
jgi:M6 family metalloprotease-like protein